MGSRDKFTSTSEGLRLNESILWFDAENSQNLTFISSANLDFLPKAHQIIATQETVEILKAYKKEVKKALPYSYNNPFSVGNLKMELLPSGNVLGGASLYVETPKGKLLYAPSILADKNKTVRNLQLKKAKILVLGASRPLENIQNQHKRKKEISEFVTTVQQSIAQNQYPIIFCRPMGTAQEIIFALQELNLPIKVSPIIYRINKIYEKYGALVGNYQLHHVSQKNVLRLFSLPEKKRNTRFILNFDGPIYYVEDSVDETQPPDFFKSVEKRFYISSTSSSRELRTVISLVAPKELYFVGPYAKSYAEEFARVCPLVKPIYENGQPTIF